MKRIRQEETVNQTPISCGIITPLMECLRSRVLGLSVASVSRNSRRLDYSSIVCLQNTRARKKSAAVEVHWSCESTCPIRNSTRPCHLSFHIHEHTTWHWWARLLSTRQIGRVCEPRRNFREKSSCRSCGTIHSSCVEISLEDQVTAPPPRRVPFHDKPRVAVGVPRCSRARWIGFSVHLSYTTCGLRT